MNSSATDTLRHDRESASDPAVTITHTPPRHYPIDYLRTFLVALVVAHHAVLAYHTYAPPAPASLLAQPRWWSAFPVADSVRWVGFDLFAGFNDTVLMSLFFFLSGLFVWNGLRRKGAVRFLRDRLWRLGAPFVIATAILSPLAYYPAYLQTPGGHSFTGFFEQWFALGDWPAGPAWFLALLLLFDAFAATLFARAPRWRDALGRLAAGPSHCPVLFFAALAALSTLAYVPMAVSCDPLAWVTFGPFAFQTSRILHYLTYFLFGVALGARGIDQGLLNSGGKLARRWPLWITAALTFYATAVVAVVIITTAHPDSSAWSAIGAFTFVATCASGSLAFLALSIRFLGKPSRTLDWLSARSYAVYLLHYAVVNWLLHTMLPVPLPAPVKGLVAAIAALCLSWLAAAAVQAVWSRSVRR